MNEAGMFNGYEAERCFDPGSNTISDEDRPQAPAKVPWQRK
jgi:hypothetical protein